SRLDQHFRRRRGEVRHPAGGEMWNQHGASIPHSQRRNPEGFRSSVLDPPRGAQSRQQESVNGEDAQQPSEEKARGRQNYAGNNPRSSSHGCPSRKASWANSTRLTCMATLPFYESAGSRRYGIGRPNRNRIVGEVDLDAQTSSTQRPNADQRIL